MQNVFTCRFKTTKPTITPTHTSGVSLTFLDSLAPVNLPSINSLKTTNQPMTPMTIVRCTSTKRASVEQTRSTPSTSAVNLPFLQSYALQMILLLYKDIDVFSVFCVWSMAVISHVNTEAGVVLGMRALISKSSPSRWHMAGRLCV